MGVAGTVALRLMVYCKSKNAKKYRRGVEYGSARRQIEQVEAGGGAFKGKGKAVRKVQ